MSIQFIFTSGIIVVVLFLIGLIYTFKEFSEMEDHPEEYRRRHDAAVIDDEKENT